MAAHRPDIRIGISGWRYPPWRGGAFYPKGLPQREELRHAASLLPTIEINGSFYSLQSPAAYAAWHDATPENFVFAIKGPRYLTHMLKLKNPLPALGNFFANGLFALRAKLGPILWQLPPQLGFDATRLDHFLGCLPKDTGAGLALAREHHDQRVDGRCELQIDAVRPLRHAVEVRHESFRCPAFIALLRRHRVALVVADTAGRWPLMEDICADFVYLRLHGDAEIYASGYGDEALAGWAGRIAAWANGAAVAPTDPRLADPDRRPPRRAHRDVYVYFDNDIKVHAPFDAARLARRLGLPSPLLATAEALARRG